MNVPGSNLCVFNAFVSFIRSQNVAGSNQNLDFTGRRRLLNYSKQRLRELSLACVAGTRIYPIQDQINRRQLEV